MATDETPATDVDETPTPDLIAAVGGMACQWCGSERVPIRTSAILGCLHCDHWLHTKPLHEWRFCATCFQMMYNPQDYKPS